MAGPDEAPAQVVRGSVWFVLSVGITAIGGFAAWAIAARALPQEVVGTASLLFASVMFVNFATGMGLPVAVARFGHDQPASVESLWVWSVLYTTLASAIGTVGFVVVGPVVLGTDRLEPLLSLGFPGVLLFFGLVNGASLAAIADMRFVSMRAWGALVLRVVGFTVVRLPLLFLPGLNGFALLVVMAGPLALSGWISAGALLGRRAARRWGRLRPAPAALLPAWRFASVNWLATLAAQAPQFTVPLIVAASVGADVNAAFYLAWSITIVVFLVPQTIGQVVLSEASRFGADSERPFVLGFAVAFPLSVLAALCGWLLAPLATVVFGASYGMATDLLPLLCAAAIPWAVTSICLSRVRAAGSWHATLVVTVGFAVATLVPTAVLVGTEGVEGAAAGWFAGNVLAAVVATATSWTVVRRPGAHRTVTAALASAPVTLVPVTAGPVRSIPAGEER